MAQATSVARRASSGRRRRHPSDASSQRPRLHVGRLLALLLLLIAASLYLGPLREFFAQQDRFQQETATLEAARADNAAMKRQVELLTTDVYIGQKALTGSMLAPPDSQVFVVKGLPGREEEDAARPKTAPAEGSFSVLDRLEDLWRTLLR